MKKVITTLIVGLFASAAFAQTPATPAIPATSDAPKPAVEKVVTQPAAASDAKSTAMPTKDDAAKGATAASGKAVKGTKVVAKKHTAKRKTYRKLAKTAKPVSKPQSANTKVEATTTASK